MKSAPAMLIALGVALASCGGNDPVAEEAENAVGLPSIDNVAGAGNGAPSADGSAPANAAAVPGGDGTANSTPAAAIPAALHGRWGLTPADCTSTRGDAKGLLVVRREGLQFYESRAIAVGSVELSTDSISADFAFTGEGQNWTKHQALALQDDKLVRTESDPMASFAYARCR